MSEVLMMIPTRNRPQSLIQAYYSVLDTSDADVIAYVDQDQEMMYREELAMNVISYSLVKEIRPGTGNYTTENENRVPQRLFLNVGPRNGPVHSINTMCRAARPGGGLRDLFPDTHVFAYMTDDSTISPKGWDRWLIETVKSFPNEIGIVSAGHAGADYVNFPAMSTNMVEAMGWFAPTSLHAWLWDTALELIGDATRIVYAKSTEMDLDHKPQATIGSTGLPANDYEIFAKWCITERKRTIERVRSRI